MHKLICFPGAEYGDTVNTDEQRLPDDCENLVDFSAFKGIYTTVLLYTWNLIIKCLLNVHAIIIIASMDLPKLGKTGLYWEHGSLCARFLENSSPVGGCSLCEKVAERRDSLVTFL